MRLAQQATLATRPAKGHRSLEELTEGWREQAAGYVGAEQVASVTSLKDRNDLPLLRADDLADPILADAADAVLASVAERHATYGRQNLLAEAHRTLHGVRFATPDDRIAAADAITTLAVQRSLVLTPPAIHHTPARYIRADGTSRLHPERRIAYTTQALLDAETRLLDTGRSSDGPVATVATVANVTEANLPGRDYPPSIEQALAVEKIATSGRVLDVLVGPAGTGKTSTMVALRSAWEAEHGPGSVIASPPRPRRPRSSPMSSASTPRTPQSGSPSGGASPSWRAAGTTSAPGSPAIHTPSLLAPASCGRSWRRLPETSRSAGSRRPSW